MIKQFAKKYFELLNNDYAGINLTRINSFEEFYSKQILDSIEPLKQDLSFKKHILKTKLFVDIGFGGGFPILPLAFQMPDIRFVGFEARKKKVNVVNEIADKLGIQNVKLYHHRIEDVYLDLPAVCSLKAVGKVDKFLAKINSNEQVFVYFFKGPNFKNLESESINKAKTDWQIISECEIEVPNTDKRYLVGFSPKHVPCGTKFTKQLVKLSDIF